MRSQAVTLPIHWARPLSRWSVPKDTIQRASKPSTKESLWQSKMHIHWITVIKIWIQIAIMTIVDKITSIPINQKCYRLKCNYGLKIWLGSRKNKNGGLKANLKTFLSSRRSFHVIKIIRQWWKFSLLSVLNSNIWTRIWRRTRWLSAQLPKTTWRLAQLQMILAVQRWQKDSVWAYLTTTKTAKSLIAESYTQDNHWHQLVIRTLTQIKTWHAGLPQVVIRIHIHKKLRAQLTLTLRSTHPSPSSSIRRAIISELKDFRLIPSHLIQTLVSLLISSSSPLSKAIKLDSLTTWQAFKMSMEYFLRLWTTTQQDIDP